MIRQPPRSTLFPYTPLSRSSVFDAGYIPADDNVPLAVRRRVPFSLAFPRSPASQSLAHLAIRLEQGVATTLQPSGFFQRMTKRSEEHTSELQSPCNLVCRLL